MMQLERRLKAMRETEAAAISGAALLKRYQAACKEMTAESIGDIMRKTFGAKALSPEWKCLAADCDRNPDPLILKELLTRVNRAPSGYKVRVLEVGVSSSYPLQEEKYFCYGTPWLSRVLAKTFPAELEVTAASSEQGMVGLVLSSAGRLGLGKIMGPSSQITAVGKGCQLLARPVLDAEFEERVFGLKVQMGVNIKDLSASFPKKKFDFIFARNVVASNPFDYGKTDQALGDGAEKILTRGGYAYLSLGEGEGGMEESITRGYCLSDSCPEDVVTGFYEPEEE